MEKESPAASTIGGLLKRLGFVRARRRRGHWPQPTRGPLTEAAYPNHMWAVDYKGWFRTRDGKRCEPLTVSDVYSRYVLGVQALHDQSHESAKEVFEKLFKKYGLPEIIRSDCGSPFASSGVGGLSRLSIWWIQLGIRPELIAPGHPEQNGVHERMHLTMKAEACQPPASAHEGQQHRFNRWRKEYNEERPHEVESGGARGKRRHLPGEIPILRGMGKSAEAIVAKMSVERRTERRAEGPRSGAIEGTDTRPERGQITRGAVGKTTSSATRKPAAR